DFTDAQRRPLLIALGNMHQAACRPRAASAAFLAAAECADRLGDRLGAVDLCRRAGGEALRSGATDAGLAALAPALREVGIRRPRSRLSALLALLYWRLRLRLRGLSFTTCDPVAIDRRARLRISTSLDLATGLADAEPVTAAAFSTRALLHALRCGDRDGVLNAGQFEMSLRDAMGETDAADRLRAMFDHLLDTSQPRDRLVALCVSALHALYAGQWAEAHRRCGQAIRLLRDIPERQEAFSYLWLRDILAQQSALSLFMQFDFATMRRVVPEYLAEMEQSGNRRAEVSLRLITLPYLYIVEDDPERAEEAIAAALDELDGDHFQLPDYYACNAAIGVALYRGDGAAALRRSRDIAPALRRSLFMRVPFIEIIWRYYRATAAVSTYCSGREQSALLRSAARDARWLSRRTPMWARIMADTIAGNVALARGDRDGA
ncbi:MAG: hypothetical protein AAGC55_29670, partial [Myxococcota bacterium]